MARLLVANSVKMHGKVINEYKTIMIKKEFDVKDETGEVVGTKDMTVPIKKLVSSRVIQYVVAKDDGKYSNYIHFTDGTRKLLDAEEYHKIWQQKCKQKRKSKTLDYEAFFEKNCRPTSGPFAAIDFDDLWMLSNPYNNMTANELTRYLLTIPDNDTEEIDHEEDNRPCASELYDNPTSEAQV